MIRKIAEAKELFEEKSHILLKNPIIKENLTYLKESIHYSNKERASVGMTQICRECGLLKRDCCGRGIELRYGKELLIINMILGVSIPERPLFQDKCHFLTEKGCLLLARDVFCINYICRSIKDSIPLEDLKRVQQLEDREIKILFELQELLKPFCN